MATILLRYDVARAKSIGLLVDFAQNIHNLGEIYWFLVRFRPKSLGYLKGLLLFCD